MRLPLFNLYRIITLLTTIWSATGCIQIDADVAGLHASAGQESFDGAGPAAGQALSVERKLTFDAHSTLASLLSSARIDSVTLTPKSGVDSLAFLSSLTLIVHTDNGDVPLIDASGNMAGADGSVLLPIAVDVDPTILEKPIDVTATVGFAAPADAWTMQIDATLTVRGHADLHP